MANTSGKQLSVGLKRAVVYELDADGFPLAVDTTVYEGLEVVGPKVFTMTIPDSRKISHVGNDRVLAIDYLPPTEGASAELRVGASDIALKAMVTNVKQFEIGEATAMAWNTDQQGFENDVAVLCFQQSLDAATRSRRWKFYLIPKGRVIPAPANMDENPAEERYTVAPNPTTQHLWGTSFSDILEGATEASIIEGMAEKRPNLVAYKGDGTENTFLLPVAKPAANIAKMVAWVDGVEQTTGVTFTTTDATFTTPPALDAPIVIYYEY